VDFERECYDYEKLSNQSLAVIQCGLTICGSGHGCKLLHPDYSAHFVLEGKGVYSVNGKDYEVGRGQGFLITPNTSNVYVADKKEPWKYIYATFKGPDAEALVRSAGLDEKNVIFSYPDNAETLNLLNCMHNAAKSNRSKGYDTLGYFLLIMGKLICEYNQREHPVWSAEQYIGLALSFIDDRSSYDISVQDIADYVGVDRTHLYRLFKKHLGISPSKQLCDARLNRAASLMENPELSMSDIALLSGFYDLSHFSRNFQRKFGASPGKYRKINYE